MVNLKMETFKIRKSQITIVTTSVTTGSVDNSKTKLEQVTQKYGKGL